MSGEKRKFGEREILLWWISEAYGRTRRSVAKSLGISEKTLQGAISDGRLRKRTLTSEQLQRAQMQFSIATITSRLLDGEDIGSLQGTQARLIRALENLGGPLDTESQGADSGKLMIQLETEEQHRAYLAGMFLMAGQTICCHCDKFVWGDGAPGKTVDRAIPPQYWHTKYDTGERGTYAREDGDGEQRERAR